MIMAWLNPGIKGKLRSQLINKLMVACSGMALVLTFGNHYSCPPLTSGYYGCGQANTKVISLQAITNT